MLERIKMTLCSLVAIILMFMCTPLSIHAEEVSGKILSIAEGEGTVQSELEMLKDYDALSLDKRIQVTTQYFSDQVDRYEEMETSLIGLFDIGRLKNMRVAIFHESELSVQMYEKMNQTIMHIRGLNTNGQEPYKAPVNEMLQAMKEARVEASELLNKLDSQLARLQLRQRVALLNAAHLAEKINDTARALEAYSKLSIMNGGDLEALTSIQGIISNAKDSYFYFNHGLVSMKNPIMNRNGKTYIPVETLSLMKGFEYTENKNTKSQLISYGSDILVITEQAATINGSYIGSPFLLINTDQGLYVDMKIVFEMFGFELTALDTFDMLYIVKPNFTKSELDRLSVEEMMKTIFG